MAGDELRVTNPNASLCDYDQCHEVFERSIGVSVATFEQCCSYECAIRHLADEAPDIEKVAIYGGDS